MHEKKANRPEGGRKKEAEMVAMPPRVHEDPSKRGKKPVLDSLLLRQIDECEVKRTWHGSR